MKKFISYMMMAMALVLPLSVSASIQISADSSACTKNSDGTYTCEVSAEIDSSSVSTTSMTITLTEKGGAEITKVEDATGDTDWYVTTDSENNGVWTVIVSSPGGNTGTQALFQFTYTPSGQTDCGVDVSYNGSTEATVTPTTTTTTSDTTTENKQTGSTLPYIALGAIAIVAVGTYVATKNKAKMYKI